MEIQRTETGNIKSLWRSFYDLERDFFDYFTPENLKRYQIQILQQEDGCEPKYVKAESSADGKMVNTPPRYIRTICCVPDQIRIRMKRHSSLMKSAYLAATKAENRSSGRLPCRFPKFYDDVYEIRIAKYPAHSSISITKDRDAVLTKSSYSEYSQLNDQDVKLMWDDIINQFSFLGIGAYIKDNCLMISSNDLLDYAGASHIQMRRRTSFSFECRMDTTTSTKAIKAPYGFMILNTEPRIIHVQQSTKPSHRMENKAKPIELDFVPDNIQFWNVNPQ